MLDTLVFDMGNVLIKWTQNEVMDNAGITDPRDRDLFMREVLLSKEWAELDWGKLDEDEALQIFLTRIPSRLEDALRRVLWWEDRIEEVEEMKELVEEMKERGLRIYLLSNATRRLPSYFGSFRVARYFDGIMVSAVEGMVKPFPEIYTRLAERYGFSPENALFIDDSNYNCVGAEEAGYRTFHFRRNADELRQHIISLL